MQPSTFTFDEQYQYDVLKLVLRDNSVFMLALHILDPANFENAVHQWVAQKIITIGTQYNQSPSIEILVNELNDDVQHQRLSAKHYQYYLISIRGLSGPTHVNEAYVKDKLSMFMRRQATKRAMVSALDLIQKEEFDEALDVIEKGMRSVDLDGSGVDYFANLDQRIEERGSYVAARTVPTGIIELDRLLRWGGVGPGELCTWLAPSNRGKSMALLYMLYRAAFQGLFALGFTLEMRKEKVMDRLDALFSGIPIHDLQDYPIEVERQLRHWQRTVNARIHIKEFPANSATVQDLKAYISTLHAKGIYPQFVVVDSGNLLRPVHRYGERRHELTETWTDLRGMAQWGDFPTHTANQTNRGSMQMELIDLDSTAEDMGIVNISDIGITINQTRQEYNEGRARLHLAKNRDGMRGQIIEILQNLKRGQFYKPGYDVIRN